jgi:hypothetical protein
MNMPISLRIHLGALAFGISALLFAAFPLVRPFFPFPQPDANSPAEVTVASQAYSSPAWVVAHFMAIGAFVLLVYAMLTLHAYLTNSRGERRAFAGMIFGLAGIALILPTLGVETYALPVLGRAYLDGQTDVAPLVGLIHSGGIIVLVLGLFLLALGAILLGIAIWSSDTLPKGAGILLTAGLVFWFPLFPQIIRTVDGLLIGIGGLWLAWTIWSKTERAVLHAPLSALSK